MARQRPWPTPGPAVVPPRGGPHELWDECRRLAATTRRYPRWMEQDELCRQAVCMLRARAPEHEPVERYPLPFAGRRIWTGNQDVRHGIDAMVLCGVSASEIGDEYGLTAETVAAYARLFFDVRRDRGAEVAAALAEALAEDAVYYVWKLAALRDGPSGLAWLWFPDPRRRDVQTRVRRVLGRRRGRPGDCFYPRVESVPRLSWGDVVSLVEEDTETMLDSSL